MDIKNDLIGNNIIEKYKLALFDNYDTYLEIIDELNSTIPSVATEMNIDPEIVKPFDYPSFCRAFIKELKLKIGKSTILLKNDLNILFMKIIEDRILSFAKSISFLPNND